MTMSVLFVFVVGAAIAAVNGANDVSKGIATLGGSGVTNVRRAVLWGTLWTGIGGVTAAFLAHAMLQTFGKGLLAQSTQPTVAAAIATVMGAALWVAIATWRGLPVSTTHAIVGSIAGVGSFSYGLHGVNWAALSGKIVLPLLLSPVISLALTVAILRIWRVSVPGMAIDCLCIDVAQPATATADGVGFTTIGVPRLHVSSCPSSGTRTPGGITINHLHWLTSGATSFARALNDAPKMVALMLGVAVLSGGALKSPIGYFVVITAGMLAGSWVAGRRVTEVLARG